MVNEPRMTPIQMAARFHDARDTAKQLLGGKYPFIIGPIVTMLRTMTRERGAGASVLDAALVVLRNPKLTDTDRLWILAAVADACDAADSERTSA